MRRSGYQEIGISGNTDYEIRAFTLDMGIGLAEGNFFH